MRLFYVVLIVTAILLALIGLFVLFVQLRKQWARRKVRQSDFVKKEEKLDYALAPFGFAYDRNNDAICSGMNPWQREAGYCRAYDEGAAAMHMIFDCEPVYFDYAGARYLIEIWKGQYGCTTGAEIGIYVNRERDVEEEPEKLFYECVTDEERLPMSFVLYKNGERILERRQLHWWLTGFRVGMYSEPGELTMDVAITFPDMMMCRGFWEGLLRVGYDPRNIRVEQQTVSFRFREPHSEQPDICGGRCRNRVQWWNRRYCKLYARATRPFLTTLDKINYLGYCFPLLYRVVIRLGMKNNARKLRKYRKKLVVR